MNYTNESLKYCIEKLFYKLKYEAEEDEVADMITDFKYIFDNELIEEEEEEEEEEEDDEPEEEEPEEEDETFDAKENQPVVNDLLQYDSTDKAHFLNNAVKKIKNK